MATYYVRKDGNDSNAGTSDTSGGAWLTCTKAATTCAAGDTCYIRAGEYAEGMTISNNGTEASPISFIGETGTKVGWFICNKRWINLYSVWLYGISGNDGLYTYLIDAEDCLVEGCTFDRVLSNYSAVNMAFSQPGVRPLRLTMRGNQFLNCTRTAELNLQGVGHLIEGNYFSAQSGQDCIRIASSYTTIRGNTFDNWSRPGGSLLHTDLIQAFSSNNEISEYNIIEGNLATNCVDCQLGNLEDQAGNGRVGNWIWRNNIFCNVDAQMSIYTPGMKFFNNVFYRCGKNGVGPLLFRDSTDRNSATGGVVRNNVFLECGNNSTSPTVGWYSSTAGITDLAVSNNFVRGTGAGTVKSTFSETGGINGSDPLFEDAAAYDFRLRAGSPLIDAGADVSDDNNTDYYENARSVPFDIGAFEFGSTPGADTTPPTPNPSTIASVTVNSTTQITVIADTATDAVSSPVEYNHSIGGVFQGWQSSATRVFTGLSPGTLYSFSVRARDSAGNATTASAASTATTDASETTTPNPLAFRSNAMLAMGAF